MEPEKNIIKISASSIQTLNKCPRSWFYRYIKKMYPEVEKDGSQEFGNFIHDIAENFMGGTLSEYKVLVSETLKKYKLNEKYKAKVIHAVKNLYIYCMNNFRKDDVIVRERKIEIPYKDKFFLTGKLDILHVRDNDITIIDWKTQKSESDHTFQLSFYMHLINLIDLIKCDSLNCEIVYLCNEDHDEQLYVSKYVIDKDDVQSAISKIEGLISTYKNLGTDDINKWRKKPGRLCPWCDFKKASICDGKSDDE